MILNKGLWKKCFYIQLSIASLYCIISGLTTTTIIYKNDNIALKVVAGVLNFIYLLMELKTAYS